MQKIDYEKLLNESKVYVEKLNMEMVPYSVARDLLVKLAETNLEETLSSVSEAINGYLKQVEELHKEL